MTKTHTFRRRFSLARGHRHLPFSLQLFELIIGLVIVSSGQGVWTTFVRAASDITPPSVPSNVQMTGRSATEVDLSWNASSDDVGVVGYHVFRNGTQIAAPTSPTYGDTGLASNTSYVYTITAYDAAGNESAQSSPLTAGTLADTSPPTTPTNLRQTDSTISSLTIAWDAASDNVGVTSYDIYRNGSLIRSQPGTTFTDSGLPVHTAYPYNIVAHDGSNNASNLSSTLVANTAPDTTPPSVPDNVHETNSTVSSVTIAWMPSTDDVGVTGYHIYRNGSLIATQGAASYTDTGLSVSSHYTYTISSYDGANNSSAQSAPFNAASSDDTTPPTIPTNVRTTDVKDTSLSIAWDASTDDVGVTGYKIYRAGSLVGTSTTTSFTNTGLTPVTGYDYVIKAYDAANNVSAASATLHGTTAYDTTAPSVPANLRSSGQTDTTLQLNWDASTDNVGVSGYDLYRNGTLLTTTSTTNFTDTGLSVSTGYTYSVRAHDAYSNNSAQSTPVSASTIADQVAPSVPTGLSATNQTTTSLDVSWSAATDDVGVTGYNVYRNGIFIAAVSTPGYSDSQLHYNATYQYAVTATDAAGNESPQSVVLAAATLADTTAPSVSLSTPSNGQTVQFTIPISATASDDLNLAGVEFYIDGSIVASINTAPFSFNWNSYNVHNGTHTVTAKAIDASGNYASQSSTITVTNPPPALIGDLNGDHRVNIYDLSILLSHWNKAGAGDFNNNGRVDIFDLSVLLARYGQDNSGYN